MQFINTTTDAEFESRLDTLVEMDSFVKAMVVLTSINDIDTYSINGNNWEMYHNPTTKMWNVRTFRKW